MKAFKAYEFFPRSYEFNPRPNFVSSAYFCYKRPIADLFKKIALGRGLPEILFLRRQRRRRVLKLILSFQQKREGIFNYNLSWGKDLGLKLERVTGERCG